MLSKIFPGAGHVYCGATSRGGYFITLTIALYLFSLIAVCGFLLVENPIMSRSFIALGLIAFLILLVVSIYVLFDSYKITRRNNPDVVQTVIGYRKAWLAAFLSSLFPGIGQLYNKQIIKGVVFIAAIVAIAITDDMYSILIIAGLFVYIYGIKDAFDSAEAMNGSDERFFHQNKAIITFMMVMFVLQTIPLGKTIKVNVVEAFKIPSGAMIPTLLIGDHLLVGKIALLAGPLKRGDIVVFPYPENPSKKFIKRVIGLGGDKIQYINGELYINEQPVHSRLIGERPGEGIYSGGQFGSAIEFEEKISDTFYRIQYLRDKSSINEGPWLVPEDSVFVMGDNRGNSQDSRVYGAVKRNGIIGKALKIYWSWDTSESKVRWDRIGEKIY